MMRRAIANTGGPSAKKRKNYHHPCTHVTQQHSCITCTQVKYSYYTALSGDMALNGRVQEICRGGRYCYFCVLDSINNVLKTPVLKIVSDCRLHSNSNALKKCPCNQLWTYCKICKVEGGDPRAGASYCNFCTKMRGNGCFCEDPFTTRLPQSAIPNDLERDPQQDTLPGPQQSALPDTQQCVVPGLEQSVLLLPQ